MTEECNFTGANNYFVEILLEIEAEWEEEFQGVLDYIRCLKERRKRMVKSTEKH